MNIDNTHTKSGPASDQPAASGMGAGGLTPQTGARENGRQATAEVVVLDFRHPTSGRPIGESAETVESLRANIDRLNAVIIEAEEQKLRLMRQRDELRSELQANRVEAERKVNALREVCHDLFSEKLDRLSSLSWVDDSLPF